MSSGSSGRRQAPSRSCWDDCENGSTLPNGSNDGRPSIEASPRSVPRAATMVAGGLPRRISTCLAATRVDGTPCGRTSFAVGAF
jgi:hypothetical protein